MSVADTTSCRCSGEFLSSGSARLDDGVSMEAISVRAMLGGLLSVVFFSSAEDRDSMKSVSSAMSTEDQISESLEFTVCIFKN